MSTYNEILADVLDEIDEDEKVANISPESIQGFILSACQQITQRIRIKDETDLRLVYGVTKYNFADSTTPVTGTGTISATANLVTGDTATGTGTISTDGNEVTGVGTLFLTELAVGKMIIVGTEKKYVTKITSNLACEISGNFDTDLSGSAFDYSLTMFTKEINIGSTIISNSVSKVVESITDAYNLVVTVPYSADQTGETFTVDTKVTEIPTKFDKISSYSRKEDDVEIAVGITPHDKFLRQKQWDFGVSNFSNYGQPFIMTQWWKGSTRYLEIYPSVEDDKQITIYGYIKINPRTYVSDALTASIPLPEDYDPIIKEYVRYRIYSRLKDKKSANDALFMFDNYIKQTISNLPSLREVSVDYQ